MWDEIPMVWVATTASYVYSKLIFPKFSKWFITLLIVWNIGFI